MLRNLNVARRRILSTATDVTQTNAGFLRMSFNDKHADNLVLRARVFKSPAGLAFLDNCPHILPSLSAFGNEVYGSIKSSLPTSKLQPKIPRGGLAFSEQGNYLCVFYGQTPAWPVEYFAQIEMGYEQLEGGNWKDLKVTREDPLAMESY